MLETTGDAGLVILPAVAAAMDRAIADGRGDEGTDGEEGRGRGRHQPTPPARRGGIRVLVGQHSSPAEHGYGGGEDEQAGTHIWINNRSILNISDSKS